MLERSVLSKKKSLNALKHITQTKQCRLEELMLEYQRLQPEGSSGAQYADARTFKKEEDAMVITTVAVFFCVCVWFFWCSIAHVYTFCKQSVFQTLRALENRLEKTQFKCEEAENITINYEKVKSHLQVSPAHTLFLYSCYWTCCRSDTTPLMISD